LQDTSNITTAMGAIRFPTLANNMLILPGPVAHTAHAARHRRKFPASFRQKKGATDGHPLL